MTLRQRDPRIKDPKYMGWISDLPCPGCLYERGLINRRVEVAHLRAASVEHGKRYTGKAEKPSDKYCLPLCPAHHRGDVRITRLVQHNMGEIEFWQTMGINPFDLCLALNAAYEAGEPGHAVIIKFTKRAPF